MDLFLTVVTGTSIAALGFLSKELLSKFIFNRIDEMSELKGKIAAHLVQHANLYSNPSLAKESDQFANELRSAAIDARTLASQVYAFKHKRNCLLINLPNQKNLSDAGGNLIAISNISSGKDGGYFSELRSKINTALKLKFDD